eukprot:TRINITY_DN23491_c0_g1_i4.p1 TRINITY_DN23491_c0_g1~~TRINITY_DN23491_c0_g1_i4.p1  ORF type:complete len:472 (-),score=41.04 TRINITY_DN23491_c0_g1_i4:73-1488(-)
MQTAARTSWGSCDTIAMESMLPLRRRCPPEEKMGNLVSAVGLDPPSSAFASALLACAALRDDDSFGAAQFLGSPRFALPASAAARRPREGQPPCAASDSHVWRTEEWRRTSMSYDMERPLPMHMTPSPTWSGEPTVQQDSEWQRQRSVRFSGSRIVRWYGGERDQSDAAMSQCSVPTSVLGRGLRFHVEMDEARSHPVSWQASPLAASPASSKGASGPHNAWYDADEEQRDPVNWRISATAAPFGSEINSPGRSKLSWYDGEDEDRWNQASWRPPGTIPAADASGQVRPWYGGQDDEQSDLVKWRPASTSASFASGVDATGPGRPCYGGEREEHCDSVGWRPAATVESSGSVTNSSNGQGQQWYTGEDGEQSDQRCWHSSATTGLLGSGAHAAGQAGRWYCAEEKKQCESESCRRPATVAKLGAASAASSGQGRAWYGSEHEEQGTDDTVSWPPPSLGSAGHASGQCTTLR